MRNILGGGLVLCLLMGGLSAQSLEKRAAASLPLSAAVAPADDLIGLLPQSDLIALIDFHRAFNDLMPRLNDMGVGGPSKMARELQEFTQKTGIDLTKAQNAVLSLKFPDTQAYGGLIIQGLDLDDKKLEAAMKAYEADYKATEYKGKQVINLANRGSAPTAGPLSLKADELALAVPGPQKLAFGDISFVKGIIDIQAGATKGGVTKELVSGLNETRNSALARFAFSLPEYMRQEALDQGDVFASVAAIKVILGTVDMGSDLSLLLDMTMRTPSQKEATELETGLRGLVSLAKGFLTGGDLDLYGQLLEQVKIASKINDVSVTLNMPRSMMDQMGKKPNGEKK
ncbi:MAG: hypothetical protein J2P31_02045 [Blastocatellia bacterium]|nr:hypothetical protein [Blastocatellia bacterium]